jgi:hypothetical protein
MSLYHEVSMKKLIVYIDGERLEDLKELAHSNKTTMASLLRFAMEEVFEEQLDAVRAERRLEEAVNDPSGTTSWEEYKAKRAGRVQARA